LRPGDVVVGAFPGARITKTRPAVVLSTEDYHRHRPDVVLGLITTRLPGTSSPTDCEIRDWRQAGLHAPSYFRLYLVTLSQREVRVIGRLSDPDWRNVLGCFQIGLGGE
jgi:mRNA interferase MazF